MSQTCIVVFANEALNADRMIDEWQYWIVVCIAALTVDDIKVFVNLSQNGTISRSVFPDKETVIKYFILQMTAGFLENPANKNIKTLLSTSVIVDVAF
jgi:hypothetical protein